jgi:hypothetical protein
MTAEQYHERLARYTCALQNMEGGEMVARNLVRLGVDCQAKDLWVLAHWVSGCAVEIVEPPKRAAKRAARQEKREERQEAKAEAKAAKPKTTRKRKPAAKKATTDE